MAESRTCLANILAVAEALSPRNMRLLAELIAVGSPQISGQCLLAYPKGRVVLRYAALRMMQTHQTAAGACWVPQRVEGGGQAITAG
jgi:hypothetical protein